jgi:3-methyladenine DNA glycosylase AlkD
VADGAAVWDMDTLLADLRHQLQEAADPQRATEMAAYLKDQFMFFGVATPARRALAKPTLALGREATGDQLLSFAEACWDQPEREFQYIAHDLLRKWAPSLDAELLGRVEALIRTKSWWDTIDALAAWTVGPMVRHEPRLAEQMDIWIDDADFWIARSAILHQLSFKTHTDADRLFSYAEARAQDQEFFIRKAIGWALRQYARVDPDEVYRFVDARTHVLSALTQREALKHRDRPKSR